MKKTQKTFAFHWGTGVIAEEAQVSGQHHLSTFQLLEYTEGQAAGEVSLRFCHYRAPASPVTRADFHARR